MHIASLFAAAILALCPAKITLYYSPTCPYSKKVLETLDEMNASVTMKDVTLDPQAKEDLRKKGGKMYVPCLIIDGKPIYNDEPIIEWLHENKECLDLSPR